MAVLNSEVTITLGLTQRASPGAGIQTSGRKSISTVLRDQEQRAQWLWWVRLRVREADAKARAIPRVVMTLCSPERETEAQVAMHGWSSLDSFQVFFLGVGSGSVSPGGQATTAHFRKMSNKAVAVTQVQLSLYLSVKGGKVKYLLSASVSL